MTNYLQVYQIVATKTGEILAVDTEPIRVRLQTHRWNLDKEIFFGARDVYAIACPLPTPIKLAEEHYEYI
jgi:hypothetical protein